MRIAKPLIFALAILSPVASYAFASDDSVANNIIKEHQEVVSQYAARENKPVPAIVEYKYGMKLDIAKVVRVSPETRVCKVMPKLMTYEDAKGELNTLQYQVMSGCRGKN